MKPLYAIYKIDGQPSKTFYTPKSKEQREELLRIGAARELTDAELALVGWSDANEKKPAAKTPKSTVASTDSDVIG